MDELSDRQLARLIRATPVLDAKLKEYWLRVLPHLPQDDRVRLLATLRRADRELDDGD
jgi:hypothetical protein